MLPHFPTANKGKNVDRHEEIIEQGQFDLVAGLFGGVPVDAVHFDARSATLELLLVQRAANIHDDITPVWIDHGRSPTAF
jgi:hypothetical protein